MLFISRLFCFLIGWFDYLFAVEAVREVFVVIVMARVERSITRAGVDGRAM